jgi:hypothetical protein
VINNQTQTFIGKKMCFTVPLGVRYFTNHVRSFEFPEGMHARGKSEIREWKESIENARRCKSKRSQGSEVFS